MFLEMERGVRTAVNTSASWTGSSGARLLESKALQMTRDGGLASPFVLMRCLLPFRAHGVLYVYLSCGKSVLPEVYIVTEVGAGRVGNHLLLHSASRRADYLQSSSVIGAQIMATAVFFFL